MSSSAWNEFLGFSTTGAERWFDTKIRGWRDDERRVAGTIITLRSIEERKALEQQLFAAILTASILANAAFAAAGTSAAAPAG